MPVQTANPVRIMFQNALKQFRQPIGVVTISLGLLPFFGPKVQSFSFNWDRTINFIQPGDKWPVEKFLSDSEKQVYQQLGRPDYFHIMWSPTGEMKMRSVIEQEWGKKGPKNMPPLSWVYMRRNEEVIFANGSYYTQPLNELEQLVLKYGDPENVKDIGNGLVEWTYYSVGKMYTIAKDRVVGTKDFPPMGSFHK